MSSLETYDIERSLGFLVHDIARNLRARYDRLARNEGFTRAQWQVMAALKMGRQGITQARLAELLEIEPITLTRHIDRLVEQGWVERRPHPTDRRARCLFMTEQAGPVMARMRALAKSLHEEAFSALDPGERDLFIDLLKRVRLNVGSRAEQEAAPGAADQP
jgi:DNA-binding MarR family transcriptional regulator